MSSYFGPTELPATKRHYPAQEAPGRPGIQQIHAPTDLENHSLKPDRSHRSSKRSSLDTQVTQVSNGGYPSGTGGTPGIHSGFGTPMKWMDIHARRAPDKIYGSPLPLVKEERVEEDDSSGEGKQGWRRRWGFTLLVAGFLILLAVIVIGAAIAVVYINKEQTAEETNGSDSNNFNRREYFLANYEASMSISEGSLTPELQNENSPLYLSTALLNCRKVNTMFSDSSYRDTYGGCEPTGIREEDGRLHLDINLKILYVVDVSLPDGVAGTAEESRILAAGLADLRQEMTDGVRGTFLRGVEAQPGLNHPEIDDEPRTVVVSPDTDYCFPHQCSGGECIKWEVNGINTSYYCQCPASRTGKNCQVLVA